ETGGDAATIRAPRHIEPVHSVTLNRSYLHPVPEEAPLFATGNVDDPHPISPADVEIETAATRVEVARPVGPADRHGKPSAIRAPVHGDDIPASSGEYESGRVLARRGDLARQQRHQRHDWQASISCVAASAHFPVSVDRGRCGSKMLHFGASRVSSGV